jgi:hypothetical protein
MNNSNRKLVFAEITSVITRTMAAVRSKDENALLEVLPEVDGLKNAGSSVLLDTLDDLICAALSCADDVVRDCMSYINSSHKEA